jgi:hypothetical protein
MSEKPTEKNEELKPTDDIVEGHGIEEDDSDDAAASDALTITGCCV